MSKNRTLIGVVCMVLAVAITFLIAPLFMQLFEGKVQVVRLKTDIDKGQSITAEMVEIVEVGTLNLPTNIAKKLEQVVGNYAAEHLFAGSYIHKGMITTTINTSDSMLRNLKDGEMAISISISSYASGLSGKLISGDIIQLISVIDGEEVADGEGGVTKQQKATIYDELQYIEVLTTTNGNGTDNTGIIEKDENGEEEIPKPETITIIVRDKLQALKLAEIEKTNMQATLVCRDGERKNKYIEIQDNILEEIKKQTNKQVKEVKYE